MKRTYFFCIASVVLIALASCEKKSDPEAVAKFSIDKDEAIVGETIEFTNESTDASDYLWDFGDGNTSTTENPSHVYEEIGTFTVTLSVNDGEDEATKSITISGSLTGTWDKTFKFDTDPQIFPATMEIEQNEDGSLDGSFVFEDGTGYTTLNNNSEIDGNDVKIFWTLAGTAYVLEFRGTVNSDFDEMSGNFYTFGSKAGTWDAVKVDDTKVAIEKSSFTTSITNVVKSKIEGRK